MSNCEAYVDYPTVEKVLLLSTIVVKTYLRLQISVTEHERSDIMVGKVDRK